MEASLGGFVMDTILTDETKYRTFTIDSSETRIFAPFIQTISDITSFGKVLDAAIQAFQICWFLEGTQIPNATGLTIKRNIIAEVFHTRDAVLIRAGDVDEEGYGTTFLEASNDFLTSLYDRYSSLNRRIQRLSSHELSILNTLSKILQ